MTKECTCCGRTVKWEALKLLGREDYGVGGTLEYRNCVCRTTLSVRVEGPRESKPPRSAGDVQFAAAD